MQVGYLGVGNMGQPMARKLLDGGHGLVVFDVRYWGRRVSPPVGRSRWC